MDIGQKEITKSLRKFVGKEMFLRRIGRANSPNSDSIKSEIKPQINLSFLRAKMVLQLIG